MQHNDTKVNFIITHDGTISLVLNAHNYVIHKTHVNYNAIMQRIKNRDFSSLSTLVDIKKTIESSVPGITIVNGVVMYGGKELHNVITEKIMHFLREGIPYQPLVAFLGNLMQNPSYTSIQELYTFLEIHGLPITEDGCILAYKGVTDEYMDIHTKTFDNSVGVVNSMPRSEVDDNRSNHCSKGFHAGTYNYAKDFSGGDGRLVLVKINPMDVVSVPSDCSCQKVRVCKYLVVEECIDKSKNYNLASY